MPRQLRSRASRPNYAALFQYDNDEGVRPSTSALSAATEGDSDSDFAPEVVDEQVVQEEDENDLVDEEDEKDDGAPAAESDREGSLAVVSETGTTPAMSAPKARNPPGLAARPRNYTLPSLQHWHRSIPLFHRPAPVERLLKRPAPFAPASIVPTNSWSVNQTVSGRVSKSWGFNVGAGPLWEMIEDRAWFKESMSSGGEATADEKCRRPRVHQDVKAAGFEIIQSEEAFKYLPTDASTTSEGGLKPPQPIACSFGPFGRQTRTELNMFDTRKIADFIPGSRAHVFNAGAPAWGLDWCPIHPDDRRRLGYKQYLAVAPFPSAKHTPVIGVRAVRPMFACIQIWSLGRSSDAMDVDESIDMDDPGEMCCEMVLCIVSGPAFELKWCPLPANNTLEQGFDSQQPGKLGILAGTFEDGSLSLYAVPDPASVTSASSQAGPICVKFVEPLLRIELEETMCWAMDWANSEVIAVGCTNGVIAVFNVADALKRPREPILPTHYFTVHQSAIRALAWVRVPGMSASGERDTDDPTVIASGGYDGLECVTDIRDPVSNAMNRTRDVVNSLVYSTWIGGPITIDHENIIKAYSLSPSMLGRGHTILEPNGPAWNLGVSDYHPQLAVGVTDGSLLTTNTLRSTRRGGSVPFLAHRVYQLDYSRNANEWRMLEKFLPQEMLDSPTASRANKDAPTSTGVWPAQVGVQRVAWNSGNGLRVAPFVASATGSGLCRVDWLLGRWSRNRIPYYGIEGIRGEVGLGGQDDQEEFDDGDDD